MKREIYINEAETAHWREVAKLLADASKAVDEARVIMLLSIGPEHTRACAALAEISDVLAGKSYLFTPQPEWMGGDSLDARNTKIRLPHIAM